MNNWRYVLSALLSIVGVVAVATFGATSAGMKPYDSNLMASWMQAIGTVVAILGAFAIARHQLNSERAARAEESASKAATVVLSLQVMANEIARMCTLSMFQKQDRTGQVIYADAGADFDAMAKMITEFPIDTVAAHGKLDSLMHLRRIAVEMSAILQSDPSMDGEQFVLKHRARNLKLTTEARRISIELAKTVEEIAPSNFTAQIANKL